jgi:hypothetical protein
MCFLHGFLSMNPRNSVIWGEAVDTGDAVDSTKRQENQGFPAKLAKAKWGRSSVG